MNNLEIPNYTLLKKLGAGAFAEVWLAEHRNNRRKAAVKILKDNVEGGDDAEALFLREGEVLASFSERNIVTIFDNAKVGNTAYLIMEFLAGGSLLDRMNERGLDVGEAIGFVVQIAAALDAAHRKDIIHRDLKPANIMLRDATTPVLTDFGASRLLKRSTIYGKDGGIVGTPHYMSPEQITGQVLDGRSDLYALGIMFHELLTGRVPYNGTVNEILALHLHGALPQLPANLAVLQPVLDQLLAKSADQRFRSGADFADALRRCFLDQAALRQLVDFAPSSAWSSQLKSLGFNLDTAERTEVRIAQGEFLKGAAGTPFAPLPATRAAPAATVPQPPIPPAVPQPAATSGSGVLAPLLLRALCVALALMVLAQALFGVHGKHRAVELSIVWSMPALLVFALVIAALAWRDRQRSVAILAALTGLFAVAAALTGWRYLYPEGGTGSQDAAWPIPVAVVLTGLLSAIALATAARSWALGGVALLIVTAGWLLAGFFGASGSAGTVLVLLAAGLTGVLWLLLAWATRRQPHRESAWTVDAGARSLVVPGVLAGVFALVLAGLALWPLLAHWWKERATTALVTGTWYGISPLGRVQVDFESAGDVLLYPQDGDGARPWLSTWSVFTGTDGASELRVALSEDDDNAISRSPVAAAAPFGLAFAPDFFDYLSIKSEHAPLPLRLQRAPLADPADPAVVVQTHRLSCPQTGDLLLSLDADGGGQLTAAVDEPATPEADGSSLLQSLQLEPATDDDEEPTTTAGVAVVWGQFADAQKPGTLEFVVLAGDHGDADYVGGRLLPEGGFHQGQLDVIRAEGVEACTVTPVDP